jgi:hypothetical protein
VVSAMGKTTNALEKIVELYFAKTDYNSVLETIKNDHIDIAKELIFGNFFLKFCSMKAGYQPYLLQFKQASGTSRGVLHTKETFVLTLTDGDKSGVGECAIFRGLSYDDVPHYEEKLQWLCQNINQEISFLKSELQHFPSIIFGWEQALFNLKHGGNLYFPSEFTEGESFIKINGLVWMGSVDYMSQQIDDKLNQGFDCINLKIGVDWNAE